MKATKFFKDKLKLTAVISYSFTEDTDPETRKSFEKMIEDLSFGKFTPAISTRFLSEEYVEDLKNIKTDLKTWIKSNYATVGAGSTINFYYTKPDSEYVKVRAYTFE